MPPSSAPPVDAAVATTPGSNQRLDMVRRGSTSRLRNQRADAPLTSGSSAAASTFSSIEDDISILRKALFGQRPQRMVGIKTRGRAFRRLFMQKMPWSSRQPRPPGDRENPLPKPLIFRHRFHHVRIRKSCVRKFSRHKQGTRRSDEPDDRGYRRDSSRQNPGNTLDGGLSRLPLGLPMKLAS